MARFPDLLADTAPVAAPDPIQEELRSLRESQAAAALDRERSTAAEAARMEQLERLYAANQPQYQPPTTYTPTYQVPQYTQDELLADPNKIYEVARANKIQGQQELVGALGPVLESMSEGTYLAKKQSLSNHPYFSYAEKELDAAVAKNSALRGNPAAIQAKFNEIVGANVQEYQRKLDSDHPADVHPGTRRLPVVEQQVVTRVGTPGGEDASSSKSPLTEDQERYRQFFNKQYGLNSSPEEYAQLEAGKLFPGQRLRK